ncbi:MAG: hypothetical protein DWH80_08575 [Planctomycetota bacterium]|nr:MAG: hypothetical protein DWH80_08575 [Planctomycetota bacterium]
MREDHNPQNVMTREDQDLSYAVDYSLRYIDSNVIETTFHKNFIVKGFLEIFLRRFSATRRFSERSVSECKRVLELSPARRASYFVRAKSCVLEPATTVAVRPLDVALAYLAGSRFFGSAGPFYTLPAANVFSNPSNTTIGLFIIVNQAEFAQEFAKF